MWGGNGEVFVKDGAKAAMKIFMAGGVSGNLKPFWKKTCELMKEGKPFQAAEETAMKLFLASLSSTGSMKGFCDDMRLFLADVAPWRNEGMYDSVIIENHPYILESFYYCDEDTERLLPYFGDFLLDSGAFTFMQGKGGNINWDDYVERYADFINRNKIEKFFELDIDSVVGYQKVLRLRDKLETLTNHICIPVWHKGRGIQEYKKHCQEYPYVAIGGYVVKELTPNEFKAFPAMIKYAHDNGAKVHCLGFTKLADLPKYHFDSVDSTAWTTGNRFGYIYQFNGKTMIKHDAPPDHRLADPRRVALHNYTEWIKFQKYAERNL